MRYTVAVLCAGVAVGQELPKNTDKIETLTQETAYRLAKHEGVLSLNGLTTISDKAAYPLAMHEGRLHLNGLTTLSDEAAKALRANPEIVLPDEFDQ
jgi:hypothetical protein